jgi:hypothetical protein
MEDMLGLLTLAWSRLSPRALMHHPLQSHPLAHLFALPSIGSDGRNVAMMSSIIKVGNDAATRSAIMPQLVLQDGGSNQVDMEVATAQ